VSLGRLAVLVAVVATWSSPECLAAQGNQVQADLVRFGDDSAESVTVPYVIIDAGLREFVFGGRMDFSGSIQLDVGAIDESLVNVEELTLNYSAGPFDFRVGAGDVSWGLSDLRSPVDVTTPRAVFFDVYNGPRLGQPLFGLSAFSQWGDIEAVIFPFPRPPHLGESLERTWDGSLVRSGGKWGERPSGGLRLARVLGSTDIALSYVHGGGRMLWVSPDGPGEAATLTPMLQQAGVELQRAVGSVVLRTEGSLGELDGKSEARIVTGAEWYPKPYLSFTVEQGWTSLHRAQASPLVDDIMFGGQLIAEEVRFSSLAFIDPNSGNRHYFVRARWTPSALTGIELELVEWAGDASREPTLALRQRSAFRVSLLRYF